MPKVLVSDKLSGEGLEILEKTPTLEVVYKPGLAPEDLLKEIADADALVIRSGTKVTAEVIDAAKKLRIIGRAGIGVDNVDKDVATQKGIAVVNTPGGNTTTTGEHAISLLVSLARHIPQATASLKAGKWEKSKFQGMELYNRTLGVLGIGNVGGVVASRAQGLGMKVIAYDPHIPPAVAAKQDIELVGLDELYERSDIITVHVPKMKETLGLLGKEAFKKVKPGVLIINAARGGIVDEDALLEALENGSVGGAALDVFTEEPPKPDHPLVLHPKVICTPHLGASTEQAQKNVAIAVANQVADFLTKNVVKNAINMPSISAELFEAMKPYISLAETLGRFQGQLCPGTIDEIEIEYTGDVADFDVAPVTIAVLKGLLESTVEEVNMVNAAVIAQQRGIKVLESKSNVSGDYTSTITTRVRGCLDRLIKGAVFDGSQARIVRIDDFMLEVIPEGKTLLIHNHDEPGVVGMVGSFLGEAGINISRMQLALSPDGTEAAMLVNVSGNCGDEVLEKLRNEKHVIAAQLVEL